VRERRVVHLDVLDLRQAAPTGRLSRSDGWVADLWFQRTKGSNPSIAPFLKCSL
jgi:hypothetical protein